MRILHCIPSMLGGGGERQLCYLAAGLVARGHSVDVAYLFDGPNGPRIRRSGAAVHELGSRSPHYVRTFHDIWKVIQEKDIQVVQTWFPRMDLLGGFAALASGRPWIYSERAVWLGSGGWRDRILRIAVERASAVVANSETGATYWRACFPRKHEVYFVPNALPLEEIDAGTPVLRGALGIPDDSEVVLFAGRFSEQKNVLFLADVIVEILTKRPQAIFLCCGIGEQLDAFREKIDRHRLGDRCRTPGYREDLWALMKIADVFISASLYEGNPNTILEAMAIGCPLVVSDIPEHRECVPRDAAVFFDQTSRASAEAALLAVLEDSGTARVRAKLARRAVESLTIASMAEAYEAIYAKFVFPEAQ